METWTTISTNISIMTTIRICNLLAAAALIINKVPQDIIRMVATAGLPTMTQCYYPHHHHQLLKRVVVAVAVLLVLVANKGASTLVKCFKPTFAMFVMPGWPSWIVSKCISKTGTPRQVWISTR